MGRVRRDQHHPPVSQTISDPTPSFPPFDSEPFQPSQVEGENGQPSLESNLEGFLDAAPEFDSNPINNTDDVNFFDFPPEDDVNFFGSEVQDEHLPQAQTIQGEQHNHICDIGSSAAQELPRLDI